MQGRMGVIRTPVVEPIEAKFIAIEVLSEDRVGSSRIHTVAQARTTRA